MNNSLQGELRTTALWRKQRGPGRLLTVRGYTDVSGHQPASQHSSGHQGDQGTENVLKRHFKLILVDLGILVYQRLEGVEGRREAARDPAASLPYQTRGSHGKGQFLKTKISYSDLN